MIRVQEALAKDAERVLPLFAGFQNPKITPAQWRSLFDYSWTSPVSSRGFLLLDEERVVGFLGTIWSERTIAGRPERICNLSSWITLPEFRNHSLLLFKAMLGLQDCTITCQSPAPQLYPLYRRFGFQDLETELRIVLPYPTGTFAWPTFRVEKHPATIAPRLGAEDRAILEAHRAHPCVHLLLYNDEEYCYLVATRTRGKRFYFSHLHYISHPAVFRRVLDRVKWSLLQMHGTPLLMIDARLVAGVDLPRSRMARLGVPHLFRSATLEPRQIDNLYGELIVLGL